MSETEEPKREEAEKGKDEEKKEPEPKVSYFDLYKFATGYDWFLIIMGWLAALVVGVSEPVIMIIFGKGMDEFSVPATLAYCDANLTVYSEKICAISMRFMSETTKAALANMTEEQNDNDMIMESMKSNIYWFVGIGGVTWLCGWIQTYCLMWSAQRQVSKLRSSFFRSIVRQDISYFDVTDTGKLNTRMVDDIKKVEDAIADKMGIAINSVAGFIGGMAIAFIYGWKMALVLLCVTPPMAFAGFLWFSVDSKYSKGVLDAYAAAGAIAEEVLSGVRTVTAFNAQPEEVERYALPLKDAEAAGTKKSTLTGLVIGFFYLVMFCMEGLAFWYGAKLIIEDEYSVAQKIIVFSGTIMGAFSLSQLGTSMESIMMGQTAAHPIFEVLARVPKIDTQSPDGVKLNADSVNGNVQFQAVHFTYPAREDQKILKNVSFSVEAGKTTALCGQSGCGKSTAFHLMKRFYDPDEGVVTLDGKDLKDINVKSLRSVIGVVSQEPVLFETSVIENIKMGALDVGEEEIHRACRQANCYDFIQALPDKWDTFVGEGGATLSGGQKQRIAIARALVRNPKILLLDEATSALDTESESIVQKALDNASKGRTTIVIAHRLSTIKNADKIICFRDGEVTEEGDHESLMMNQDGVYYNLCNMQTFDSTPTDGGRELDRKKSSLTKFSRHSIKSAKDEAAEKAAKEDLPDVGYMRILKANAPEWYLMAVGALFSMGTGALQPLWALFFADIFQLYGSYDCAFNAAIRNYTAMNYTSFEANGKTFDLAAARAEKVGENEPCNLDELKGKVVHLSIMFCLLGVLNFVGFLGSTALFGVSAEKLTTRLRKDCFKKLLSLEIAYFDDPLNSTGALTTRLSSDASKVQGATGAQINCTLKTMGAFICGFAIGFYYSWELTLACFAFTPPLVVCSALMMNIFTGKGGEEEQKSMEECGRIATEATINIQTVVSLGREDTFAQKYDDNTQKRLAGKGGKINYYGFMYGACRGIMFMMYAAIFWFTTYLLQIGRLDGDTVLADMMKVLFGIMFAAMTAGDANSMAPDYGDALTAAKRIFALLDRESSIDPLNEGGVSPDSCKGEVTFESVEFSYPSRPDVKVLKGLSVTVKPGETLALVGQSGCGKSTCIQLIERFYDGSAGNVSLDGHRVQELNVKWLRRQIGFVQQEPILFDKTIKENITYGGETTSSGEKAGKSNRVGVEKEAVSAEAVEKAAAEANALDFIQSLPAKFDTMCGKKGGQLSGGQKQRVAIARALVRQPKILLLDEATSALDAESEKLVQSALNAAQEGRTCILIAHRLSTVINADKIAVLDNGTIIEIGTHQSLLEKRGAYYSLVNSQLS